MTIIRREVKLSEIRETIKFRRGNILLIILGYLFAVFAGVNGIQGINHTMWRLFGDIPSHWTERLISILQILCIYGCYKWGSNYAWKKQYTPADDGISMYEHPKYDKFTQINGVLILFVGFIAALLFGCTLHW